MNNKMKRFISAISSIFILSAIVFLIVYPSWKNKHIDQKKEKVSSGKDNNSDSVTDNTDHNNEIEFGNDSEEYTRYFDLYKNYDKELTYIREPLFQYDLDNKLAYKSSGDNPYGYTQEEDKFIKEVQAKEQIQSPNNSTDYPLQKGKIKKLKESFELYDRLEYITINDVKVYDNLNEINKDYFQFKDEYEDYLDNNGSLKKIYYNDKEADLKLAVIDVTLKSCHPWVTTINMTDLFSFIELEEREDGWHICNEEHMYYALNNNNEKSLLSVAGKGHRGGVYFAYYDDAIYTGRSNRTSFFWNFIGKDEEVTFNLGFWVDADEIDNLYLLHSFNNSRIINPDSLCQVAVKLT